MSLKSAAFLALVGTLILTLLLAADFITALTGVMRDVVPVMALLRSFVYLFASLTITIYFFSAGKDR